jgi:arylsulfatase A-like enzyme
MTLVSNELKKAGYSTAAVGKWHVGCAAWEQTPLWRGFDTFMGFLCNGQMDFSYKKNDGYYGVCNPPQSTHTQHAQPQRKAARARLSRGRGGGG